MFEKRLNGKFGQKGSEESPSGLVNVPEFVDRFVSDGKKFVEDSLSYGERVKKKDLKFRS